ncbi:MAG TPA: dioxygenase [Chloroflexia bacterium]|nr:dioxygenase [Chloroflexia bacterium]
MRTALTRGRGLVALALSAALLLAACDMGPAPSTQATPTTATAAEPTATTAIAEAEPTATEAVAEAMPTATEAAAVARPTATSEPVAKATATTPVEAAATATTETAAAPPTTCSGVLTPAQTEGPYYTPGTPERASLLEEGMPGTVLVLTGYVYDENCQPVPGAWLDFWQADANGEYDNSGFRLRGHQYTDANGRYTLTTVIPGEYPGRTPHIHVKVQAPEGPVITGQLYVPGAAGNTTDRIYNEALLIQNVQQSGGQTTATFDFVIDAGE